MFLTRLLIIINTESWNLRLKGLENVNAMKTGLEALTPSPALSSCVWPRLRAVTGLTELLCTCTLSALPLALLSEHTDSACVWASAGAARRLRSAGSAVVAPKLSCSGACGISLDQGSNPCLLHWQTDSQPLDHQGSPVIVTGHLGLRIRFGDLPRCTVYRNMPASKGDTGSIPGLDRFHMPQSN